MKRVVCGLALALALAGLVGCQPDPTTGRPPPPGAEGVPAFRSYVNPVKASQLRYSWRPGCPVGPSDLRVLTVDYWGYDGRVHLGRLIVHENVVASVRTAFGSLHRHRFQIRRIHPIDNYRGSDTRSMQVNNTSAFNCRRVTGGTSWSHHSYGWAIDINPRQNPYVRNGTVLPPEGRSWLNRREVTPGMIVAGGPAVRAFAAIGWGWGGNWRTLKDYQHFSASNR